MAVRLLQGDCRVTLPTLPADSVQACITSPPYYGLRDYGTPPLVWGDWLGSHGLEPTPEMYIQHEVEIFREVRRVLRPDGTLWLNLGDSYAGSGNGQNDRRPADASPSMRQLGPPERGLLSNRAVSGQRNGAGPVHGYKAKDLMMMPFRVAMALQADGWYVRSCIPWLKRNAMPESVTDRPSTSVEYVFLLAKSARYYWDADAVRIDSKEGTDLGILRGSIVADDGVAWHAPSVGRRRAASIDSRTAASGRRNRRNGDWFFESWQGLLGDEDGDPLALVVNPQPFKGSHFATFPPKLVEPMVKASTRAGDTVLDPFGGAGTVGLVADRLGRNAVLCELKPDYAEMGADRITSDAPLFTHVDGATGMPAEHVADKQAALGKRTYSGFNARWDAKEAAS